MKKIFGVVVLGLLLSSKAFAESEKCKSLPKYSNLWYYNKCDEQKPLKYKMIVHAEMNLIYNAADNGVSLKGSTVYVVGLPACRDCAKGLIQVGVERVVMPMREDLDDKWSVSCADAQSFFDEAGVKWEWIKL